MVKWEYLDHYSSTDPTHDYDSIMVGPRDIQALAQYLQGAFPSSTFKIDKGEIRATVGGCHLHNALGDLGWELVATTYAYCLVYHFKRPRAGQ